MKGFVEISLGKYQSMQESILCILDVYEADEKWPGDNVQKQSSIQCYHWLNSHEKPQSYASL